LPTRSRRPPPPEPDPAGSHAHSRDLRSFGRRRGRRLSARQQALLDDLLPRLRIDPATPAPQPPRALFPASVSELWLEIGFGAAEHLVWQARQNPHAGLIGCEVFEDGIVKALTAVEEHGLQNVRIADADAREVLRWLPQGTLARAFILFPDPWPKKRHVKRRLVNRALLDLLADTLAPGGELRLATDIGDYARTMLLSLKGHSAFAWEAAGPEDWRRRPPDWPPTRYEGKALREGRRPYYFRFRRR
jgi:tRNA (guanine-N7-)-methyltransferase